MISEISQTQDKYCMILLTCGVLKRPNSKPTMSNGDCQGLRRERNGKMLAGQRTQSILIIRSNVHSCDYS